MREADGEEEGDTEVEDEGDVVEFPTREITVPRLSIPLPSAAIDFIEMERLWRCCSSNQSCSIGIFTKPLSFGTV